MSRKPLIILLVVVVIAMGFLIWMKNGEDIDNKLNSNIPKEQESGETTVPDNTGGIDINLSGDSSISTENNNSGESVSSGDNLGNIVDKDSTTGSNEESGKENGAENNSGDNEKEPAEVVDESGNPILVSDDTKLAFRIGATQTIVYYYEGEKITKKEAYIDYKTEDNAKNIAAQYNDGTKSLSDIGNVKSATSKGKYVVMTYAESEYDYLTYSKVKNIYGMYEITK